MKKYLLGSLLVCSLSLVACSNNSTEEATAASTEQSTVKTTEEEPEATFEDGVLESDDFTLAYKDAKIINSPMEEGPGLYVTYTLENKLDENINPQEILDVTVMARQENDTSEVELANDYHSVDAFGERDEDYNTYGEQVDKENAVKDDLKPGKEVEIVNAFSLDNKEEPVQLQMLVDLETKEYSDPYEIKLEDLEEIPEPESEDINEQGQTADKDVTTDEETESEDIQTSDTEYRDTEQEAQDDYWKAKEFGLTEDEIAEFTTNKWYGDPAENDGSYYEDLDDYLNEKEAIENEEYNFEEDEITEEEAQENIEQVEQFRKNFKAENGREPTSGEIQAQW